MKHTRTLPSIVGWLASLFSLVWILPTLAGLPEPWRFLNVLPQGNDLRAVWIADTNNVFVGGDGGAILHWNGRQWTPMPTPTQKTILSLHGLSATDVWAVGGDAYTLDRAERSLILHYNGVEWQSVPAPVFSGETYVITSVHAIAPNDVWATQAGGTWPIHWDGTAWSFHQSVFLPVEGSFRAITSVGADHIFLVGTHGQILHRNHGTWTLEQKTESGNISFNILNAVWASDIDHVYTGGNWGQFYRRNTNGTWTSHSLDTGIGSDNQITALWSPSPDFVYLLGGFSIRKYDFVNPPTRVDFTGKKRGQWITGAGPGNFFIGVGYNGTAHEVILDAPGGAALSALTVSDERQLPLLIRGAAACGANGALVFGTANSYGASSPLFYFDGAASYPIPDLPPGLTNTPGATIAAVLATSLQDITVAWTGSYADEGVLHWNGTSWNPIGSTSWSRPKPFALWRSPSGKLYAASAGSLHATDDTGEWQFLLAFDQIPTGCQITALGGRSDTEVYVSLNGTNRILRYDGAQWHAEVTPAAGAVRSLVATAADVYAVGEGGLAWRRTGATWTQLAGVEVRNGDQFTQLIAATDGTYALQTTDPGITGGGKGRVWRFNGATATMVIKELSQPLQALVQTGSGVKYGFVAGKYILSDGPAPAGLTLQRVSLADSNAWTALGETGASLKPAASSSGRPMVAAWRIEQTNPMRSGSSQSVAGAQQWQLLQETFYGGAALPPVFVRLQPDPALLPAGYAQGTPTLFRFDGMSWTGLAANANPATAALTSSLATGLSLWTFGATVNPPPVRLTIRWLSPDQFRLSWPAAVSNVSLECIGEMPATGPWDPLPNPIIITNDQRIVTLGANQEKKFYRLKPSTR